MYTLEAITAANEKRPNKVDDEKKAYWLGKLDAEVAETMQKDYYISILWPENQELLMPAPYDDIYVYYLCCQIDLANEDLDLYENDFLMYTTAKAEALGWWRRNHEPKNRKCFEVM